MYAIFLFPNVDGVVPETNNATKLPSKGNEQIEQSYYVLTVILKNNSTKSILIAYIRRTEC